MKTYPRTVLLGVMHQCHRNSTPGKITKIQYKNHTHPLGSYFRQLLECEDQAWDHIYPLCQEELTISAVCKKALKGRNGFRDMDLFILTTAYLHIGLCWFNSETLLLLSKHKLNYDDTVSFFSMWAIYLNGSEPDFIAMHSFWYWAAHIKCIYAACGLFLQRK